MLSGSTAYFDLFARHAESALQRLFEHMQLLIQFGVFLALGGDLANRMKHGGVVAPTEQLADFYKIKIADMYSKKRPASNARPRQIAMYLAKEMTQKSLPEIGGLFGGRDHTTVLHAVRKIGGERQKNTELNQQLHVLEQTLKG